MPPVTHKRSRRPTKPEPRWPIDPVERVLSNADLVACVFAFLNIAELASAAGTARLLASVSQRPTWWRHIDLSPLPVARHCKADETGPAISSSRWWPITATSDGRPRWVRYRPCAWSGCRVCRSRRPRSSRPWSSTCAMTSSSGCRRSSCRSPFGWPGRFSVSWTPLPWLVALATCQSPSMAFVPPRWPDRTSTTGCSDRVPSQAADSRLMPTACGRATAGRLSRQIAIPP